MKNHSAPSATLTYSIPGEAAIRDYAYHLYEQSGRAPGRDLDNWLEACVCLRAQAPVSPAHPADTAQQHNFGASEPGRVHAATGHARGVKEQTAHTSSHRHS